MGNAQELVQQKRENEASNRDISRDDAITKPIKNYTKWSRVSLYIVFILAGQSSATLLGKLYYDKGGNSKWMATFVQSAGFPILVPLMFFFQKPKKTSAVNSSLANLFLLYLFFGIILTGDNLMYSYGLLYLPVSTYSLLCATQLAFNALFSFFLNSQKFTALISNSLVLLTISASLLAVHSESDGTTEISKGKYAIGFLCTIGASATYSLYLSLLEVSFKKLIKMESFRVVLDMQIYPSFVATCGCVVGLFASKEWENLGAEMEEYKLGGVSYIMTLVWIAISWQIASVGLLGLIFEVSSLFTNVIGTLGLPVVPVLSVIFFNDKMDGIKVIALLLAIWGFLSYVYQHYLDDIKSKKASSSGHGNEVLSSSLEPC
ncbi:hypothetical protein LIER_35771 [Lithospermum erythrorhizon]|uniref:Probable purine permease n=1 Tax=Lithospermum erythrorhizon TaxID=34254 RepID=A0AAV3P089_LITER